MVDSSDWRDTFCGRKSELAALVARYEEVAAGKGPRLAVVLGERGMGKTRLVQELYRVLATRFDPQNYWPDASFFAGSNLRVAPELSDPSVRAHYENFKLVDRPMPFLWWGFRLSDPDARNAARSDMASHRATLDPHLAPLQFARRIAAARQRMRAAAVDAGSELGKNLFKAALKVIPGVGSVATVVDLFIDYAGKGKDAAAAVRGELGLRASHREANLLDAEATHADDIHERTLDDLAAVLAPAKDAAPVPVVVFCDDAQFAREGGDEGALRFIATLWERAHLADWPLMLVLTHWGIEWHRADMQRQSCASTFGRDARSAHSSLVIDLPKESALAQLVTAGLPSLPPSDATLLLGKADGNPQVLIELVDLVRRSPAWRKSNDGPLTAHARREIERRASRLAELILERLESDATPEAVRKAVALSSVQGMEFLCILTEAAATAFEISGVRESLRNAESPHRLISGADAGVACFLQRAYAEAASLLVGRNVGDPAQVREALRSCALSLSQEDVTIASLRARERKAVWGVLVGLSEDHADPAVRLHAARALCALIREAQRDDDHARAAELAQRLNEGLERRWSLWDLPIDDVHAAICALADWQGSGSALDLAAKLLVIVRDKHHREPAQFSDCLSDTLSTVGLLLLETDDIAESVHLLDESLSLRRQLVRTKKTEQSIRDWAFCASRVGYVRKLAGKDVRHLLRLRWRALRRLPTPDPYSKKQVADACYEWGLALSDWGPPKAGEDFILEAMALREELAAEVNSAAAWGDFAESLRECAWHVAGKANFDEAGVQLRKALEVRAMLVENTKADVLSRRQLALARLDLAKLYMEERQFDASLQTLPDGLCDKAGEEQTSVFLDQALTDLTALEQQLRTLEATRDVGVALLRLADWASEPKDRDSRCKYLQRAEAKFRAVDAVRQSAQSRMDFEEVLRRLDTSGCGGPAGE